MRCCALDHCQRLLFHALPFPSFSFELIFVSSVCKMFQNCTDLFENFNLELCFTYCAKPSPFTLLKSLFGYWHGSVSLLEGITDLANRWAAFPLADCSVIHRCFVWSCGPSGIPGHAKHWPCNQQITVPFSGHATAMSKLVQLTLLSLGGLDGAPSLSTMLVCVTASLPRRFILIDLFCPKRA